MSGAGIWVPANHHALAAGIDDSAEEALNYIRAAAPEGWREREEPLWRSLVRHAPAMLRFVEANTPLRFALTSEPEAMPHLPGARTQGRMVSPRPLGRLVAERFRRRLRPSTQPHIFTCHETVGTDLSHHPRRTSLGLAPRLARRWLINRRSQGTALIAGLLRGCLDHGCTIALNCPATRLVVDDDGGVCGVEVEYDGRTRRLLARHGVVLASGGFEWDSARLARHSPGPIDFIAGPRTNTGDAHRMAEEVGVEPARMDQGNINSAIPGRYERRPHGMALFNRSILAIKGGPRTNTDGQVLRTALSSGVSTVPVSPWPIRSAPAPSARARHSDPP